MEPTHYFTLDEKQNGLRVTYDSKYPDDLGLQNVDRSGVYGNRMNLAVDDIDTLISLLTKAKETILSEQKNG